MLRKLRIVCLCAVVLVALPAVAARAAVRMPVGFYDDSSFRYSPQAAVNLANAQREHASVVHVLVQWNLVAPTRPSDPLSGSDPAYRLSDLDSLVRQADEYGLQVLMTITGTPSWANGGQSPNHPPTNLTTLTDFAHMLAARYDGKHAGVGAVSMFSVWNEPNLGLFLVPQYSGTTIVSAAEYVKLFNAAYKGIKAGNPSAVVAAGETSNRGRDKPTGKPGEDSVAPATFAELVAKIDPHLPFAAWATHPYPADFKFGPTQKVAYPNVSLSTMAEFGADLAKWFHRPVPIWITEYGELVNTPQFKYGVSETQLAKDASKALALAAADPYVHMFIWFIFRNSAGQLPPIAWNSGLEATNGSKLPAYSAFAKAASRIVGQSQVVRPNGRFSVSVAVPFLYWHGGAGSPVGLTWAIKSAKGQVLAAGQSREPIQANEEVTFPVAFDPVKGVDYTLTVTFNNAGGQKETHVVALIASGSPQAV